MNLSTRTLLVPALALALGQPTPAAQTATPSIAPDSYTIDPAHSEAAFRIRHLIGKISGKFQIKGSIRMDPANQSRSSVEVVIDAAGITTSSEARDKDLRSARFFDVANYPSITFKSSSVTALGPTKLQVTGTLTMHGQAKTIVIPVDILGTGPGAKPGTFVASFEGSLKLDRTDFGIKAFASDSGDVGLVGKEVDITLSVEADKVQPAP